MMTHVDATAPAQTAGVNQVPPGDRHKLRHLYLCSRPVTASFDRAVVPLQHSVTHLVNTETRSILASVMHSPNDRREAEERCLRSVLSEPEVRSWLKRPQILSFPMIVVVHRRHRFRDLRLENMAAQLGIRVVYCPAFAPGDRHRVDAWLSELASYLSGGSESPP